MDKYKINPTAVNQLVNKYKGLSVTFVVDGEESFNQNETKANQLKVNYKGIDYKIDWLKVGEYKEVFEISKVGVVYDTVIDIKETIVSAIYSIIDIK